MGVIMTRLFVAVLAALMSMPVCAQVYKCTQNGKTVFSDVPCTGGEEMNIPGVKKTSKIRFQDYMEEVKKEAEEREKQQQEKDRKLEQFTKEHKQKLMDIEEAKLAEFRKTMPDPSMECDLSDQDRDALDRLHKLFGRYKETADVAKNTPVSSIGPALLKLSDIKQDIEDIDVKAECARNIKSNAMIFIKMTQEGHALDAGMG